MDNWHHIRLWINPFFLLNYFQRKLQINFEIKFEEKYQKLYICFKIDIKLGILNKFRISIYVSIKTNKSGFSMYQFT